MFTDVGFHLKSGLKKLLCSQMLVFTFILVSRKYCVHPFSLYPIVVLMHPVAQVFGLPEFWTVMPKKCLDPQIKKEKEKKREKKSLLWYRCYYPHWLRDSVSPRCGIFVYFLTDEVVLLFVFKHSSQEPSLVMAI